MTGMPAATARSIDGPSASASGIDTTRPSGSWFTAASISWLIATMSKVSGERKSTFAPVCSAAFSTPFLTTDQKGSLAWPWATTMMSVAMAGAAAASTAAVATEVKSLFIGVVPPKFGDATTNVIALELWPLGNSTLGTKPDASPLLKGDAPYGVGSVVDFDNLTGFGGLGRGLGHREGGNPVFQCDRHIGAIQRGGDKGLPLGGICGHVAFQEEIRRLGR